MEQTKNKKLWFKAKMYGWGWYPSTWQGFIIILLAILVFVLCWLNIMRKENILVNSIVIIIDFAVLFTVCYLKGEKPRWRWGK